MRIALVGCGFLGSLFAEEMAKRFFSHNDAPDFVLIDSDKFEERNAANQNVSVHQAQMKPAKAAYIGKVLEEYHIPTTVLVARLDKTNIEKLLAGATHIVSAVDNLPTRRLLWYYAKQHKIPLLHLGVSQQGTGNVEWTYGVYDSWAMNPLATLGQTKKLESAENIPRELKPCELIAFRGLGLNVAIAAAKSFGIFVGIDPEKVVNETLGLDVLPNTVSTWSVTNTSHQLVEMKELNENGALVEYASV